MHYILALGKHNAKHLYWLYSNEILDIEALEYDKYFTHIDLWRTLKNSQVIHGIVETKFRMIGQAVSKYAIDTDCFCLCDAFTAFDPPLKRLF